jgi:hypothetical protein
MRDLDRYVGRLGKNLVQEDLSLWPAVRPSDPLVAGPHVNNDRHPARVRRAKDPA